MRADTGPLISPILKAPLRFKDFADLVTEACRVNRREVRSVPEAALTLLHARLKIGEVLVLPPLGRLRVVRDDAGVRTIKLRDVALGKAAKAENEPLAGSDD